MGLFGSKSASPPSYGPSVSLPGLGTLTPSSSGYSSYGSKSSGLMSGVGGTIMAVVGGIILLIVGVTFYDYVRKSKGDTSIFAGTGSSGDTTLVP